MTSRLFISLDIPNEVRENLIEKRDDIYGLPNDIRWEKEEKLHITLKFLGDVGQNILDLMIQRFDEIEFNRFSVKFDKFSFFKKDGMLKILFASFENNSNLLKFHEIVDDEFELLGFRKEKRKFYPHITLLRIKGKEDYKRLNKFHNKLIESSEFEINTFSIYESRLKPTGSEYIKIKSFKLL